MHDIHTHIGQFNDVYYDYHDVFSALTENGITETTLAYLTPKFDSKKHALDFYHAVVQELIEVKKYAEKIGLKTNILHWCDPLVFGEEQGDLSLWQIFSDFEYAGLAIHPVLHQWSTIHATKLDGIFDFAKKQKLPIYIHTGISECDEPKQFIKWFQNYPEVEVHLAHCKATDQIIEIFSKFKNIFGDTAFCPIESYQKICEAGFKDRMFFGTDFPITHYYDIKYTGQEIPLKKEYKKNCHFMKLMK